MKLITSAFLFFMLVCSTSYSQLSSDQIFESFKQGQHTNCSSIAFIKAALNVYGLDNLFVSEQKDSTFYKITLKNNATFSLNADELNKAKLSADFISIKDNCDTEKIIDYAILTYAVMAKYKEIIDKEDSFEKALKNLESGEVYTPTIYKYLGFEKNKQVIKLKRLEGNEFCGVVAYSSEHAVFVCEDYMDYYGNKKSIWLKYPGRFKVINNHDLKYQPNQQNL